MSDENPGVHYQISVTGRQAAAFFLVLLVALGLAFYFGMRTGAAATKGPGAATTLAQVSDLPVPTAPSTADAAPAKPEEVKLGFAPAGKGSSAPVKEAPAAPAPVPTAAPTPAPTPAPPSPTPVPKLAKKAGPFFAQVLATQKADVADEMTKKLRADGFAADVTPVPGKPGWFRVRVGPYADRSKAEAAATKIKKVEKTKNRPLVVP
ncbi:MAG: SPOR domain-containing protein [Thermoanaerobaculia bacterium]